MQIAGSEGGGGVYTTQHPGPKMEGIPEKNLNADERETQRMRKMNGCMTKALLAVTFMLWGDKVVIAQNTTAPPNQAEVQQSSQHSIEDLNYVGGMSACHRSPRVSWMLIPTFAVQCSAKAWLFDSSRRFKYGTEHAGWPSGARRAGLCGTAPIRGAMTQAIFTAHLRQLHLSHTQLNISGVWNWVSWGYRRTEDVEISSLFVYKEFGNYRVEIKVGYI